MNLMELFVKIEVDDKASNQIESITNNVGKGLKSAARVGVKAIAVASSAIIGLTSLAIKNYAEYEQLVGGVETLFGKSADRLMGYAENAYMTAGISANKYMELATSFSASLLQSLEGDTKAAADYADMAITDMSDNANKMGTNIESLQWAYQGFAKGNFTMLDNLKLGYGGTRAEMERLLADAKKITGIHYDINNLSDIIAAIHVIQTEIGITGTTMEEAKKTITGSLMMTQAAWSNLVTGIADDNADFEKLIDNFIESAGYALNNLLPRVEIALTGVAKLIDSALPIIMEKIPSLISDTLPSILASAGNIVMTLVDGIIANAPLLLTTALDIILKLAEGLAVALPELVPALVDVVFQIVTILTSPETLSALFDAALAIIVALGEGLIKSIPTLIKTVFALIEGIINTIKAQSNALSDAGKEIVLSLIRGIENKISNAVSKAKKLASKIVGGIKSGIGGVVSIGRNLVEGLWRGVSDKVGWVTEKMASFGKKVLVALKKFFGIKSPSTLMRDEIGRYLAEGVAVGFVENDPMTQIEASLNNGVKSMRVPSVGLNAGSGMVGRAVSVVQNIYSQAQTAADLMQEAVYQQEKAVYLGV